MKTDIGRNGLQSIHPCENKIGNHLESLRRKVEKQNYKNKRQGAINKVVQKEKNIRNLDNVLGFLLLC